VGEEVGWSGGLRRQRAAPVRWSNVAVTWIETEAMVEWSRKSCDTHKREGGGLGLNPNRSSPYTPTAEARLDGPWNATGLPCGPSQARPQCSGLVPCRASTRKAWPIFIYCFPEFYFYFYFSCRSN
jgi:hypothetical protein